MSYQLLNISPTATQVDKVSRAMREKKPIKISLSKSGVQEGEYPLMLTKAQHRKMMKSRSEGKGCGLNLSPKQLKESMHFSEVQGGGWFSDVGNFLVDNIVKPVASSFAGKYLGPLGSTAVNALSGIAKTGINAADKAISKGRKGKGVGGCDGAVCPNCEGSGFILPLVGAVTGALAGKKKGRPPMGRPPMGRPPMGRPPMGRPPRMMREPKNYMAPPPRGGAIEGMVGREQGPTALY